MAIRDGLRRDIRLGAALVVIFAGLKLCQLYVLAFSSQDVLASFIGALPVILFIVLWVRAIFHRKYLNSVVVVVSGLIGILPPYVIGLGEMLGGIYRVNMHFYKDYASVCRPAAGEPADGGTIRVCERQDWESIGTIAVLVRFDGDPGKLTSYGFNQVPAKYGSLNSLIPLGIIKYRLTEVSSEYYLLFFSVNDPVMMDGS